MSHKLADVVSGCEVSWIELEHGMEAVDMISGGQLDIAYMGFPACMMSALSHPDPFYMPMQVCTNRCSPHDSIPAEDRSDLSPACTVD